MPVEVVMPKLGLTMASGTIARWIKRPGEAVREGEPLVEVATDKIAYEVEAPATGTLARALGADGDEFACGDVIGTIALAGEMDTPVAELPTVTSGVRAAEDGGTSTAPDAVTTDGAVRIVEAPRISGAANGVAPTAASATPSSHATASDGGRVIASPAARRLARERGLSLGGVRGTGPRGRITMSDVSTFREPHDDSRTFDKLRVTPRQRFHLRSP